MSKRDYIKGKLPNRKLEPVGKIIREIRLSKRMTARALSERIGIDPRLLNAIEMGRIRSPSLERLSDIAGALGISLPELLAQYEGKKPGNYVESSSSGEFVMDFSRKGFKLISYTPPIPEMFCGKIILDGKKKIDSTKFSMRVLIFIQVIIGKLLVNYQGEDHLLKEGRTLLLNGRFEFGLQNPTMKGTSFLFFTSPAPWGESFLEQSS